MNIRIGEAVAGPEVQHRATVATKRAARRVRFELTETITPAFRPGLDDVVERSMTTPSQQR